MARVIGVPGRNATDESRRRQRRVLVTSFVLMAGLGAAEGFCWGALFPVARMSVGTALSVFGPVIVSLWIIACSALNRIDALTWERAQWQRGVVGEQIVADSLGELPDDFIVINDVTGCFGNIDQVVIGPTGVYLIDAKNWRGTVDSDGKGELLINGKPATKSEVKRLLGSVMDFQRKLKVLCDQDYFVRGLMAFPNAHVNANFGTTRQIHCLRDDRLVDYIRNKNFKRRLSRTEITRIERATLQLAGMDPAFASTYSQTVRSELAKMPICQSLQLHGPQMAETERELPRL